MKLNEVIVAVFFLLIAAHFIVYDATKLLGLDISYRSAAYDILMKLIFIFGVASGALMLRDALKKGD